jgi:DNA-binding response OmpR family regulator
MPKILLIEPNKLQARQYQEYLVGIGYEVVWVQAAQDAVNAADKSKPDLIIMEILLTAHSGIEFLNELRSYPEWLVVPIIILSRLPPGDFNTDAKTLERLGIAWYLYKPDTSLQKLKERISSELADKGI